MRKITTAEILPYFLLAMLSVLAYLNAWPNALVWDDQVFTIDGRFGGISLANIKTYFAEDAWAIVGTKSGLYRPLLMISVALDMQIVGDWLAGMHLINILLQVLATLTVYGLIHHVLLASERDVSMSRTCALLAAIIFAVHPVHTEVVNSIFNRSEMLATLFIAGGLWWFLQVIERKPVKAWFLLALAYLLAMLSRETGIILPAIAVVFLWVLTSGTWKQRLRRCLPIFWLLLPLAIYLALRTHALESPAVEQVEVGNELRQQTKTLFGLAFVGSNVLNAVAVWFDSLVLMLWPNPLFTFHHRSQTNVWLALASQTALFAFAAYKALNKQPGMFLGLSFFYLTILPASRIIGPVSGHPHLAERYLYTPSVGLAIAFAFFLYWIAQKLSLRAATAIVLITAMILTPLTWARNSQWSSSLRLIESDYLNGARSAPTLRILTTTLIASGSFSRAEAICNEHAEKFDRHWYIARNCGQVYATLGRYDLAEEAFNQALKDDEAISPAHYGLATLFIAQGRKKEAEEQFKLFIAAEKGQHLKEYMKTVTFPPVHNRSERGRTGRNNRYPGEQGGVAEPTGPKQ